MPQRHTLALGRVKGSAMRLAPRCTMHQLHQPARQLAAAVAAIMGKQNGTPQSSAVAAPAGRLGGRGAKSAATF